MSLLLLLGLALMVIATGLCLALGYKRLTIAFALATVLLLLANGLLYFAITHSKM